jgi:spermidine/putrescine transport system ATP-binding protein
VNVLDKKPIIILKNLCKKFDGEVVVDSINLTIYENEFITLLGPSGCGKTTTLRMIGGFESPDSGEIIIDNKIINNLPPYARPINTVFQKYALFPNMDVIGNVSVGLRNRNYPYLLDFFKMEEVPGYKKIIKEKILEASRKVLKMVGLEGFEHRKIDQMSGGQQQRVALARAIINKPRILLLDEPLSALDLKLRQNMQYELKEMQRLLGITFIFVTHDQEEAMTMSDRIVVMSKGIIVQEGTNRKIYNEPVNKYVAKFVGESNIFEGLYLKKDLVKFLGVDFKCMGYTFENNEKVNVVIRPEDWDVVDLEKASLIGIVRSIVFKGVHNELEVDVKGLTLEVNSFETYQVGEQIGLKVDPYEIHLMKYEQEEKEDEPKI